MMGRLLKFKLGKGRPFSSPCAVHGWEEEFEAVFSTRFDGNGVLPLAALSVKARAEILSLPPPGEDDPRIEVEDFLLGRVECVGRTLALDIHADNGTWTSAELPFLLCLDKSLDKALIGNGFMATQWRGFFLSARLAVVSTRPNRMKPGGQVKNKHKGE
jgi:hypothetical protein